MVVLQVTHETCIPIEKVSIEAKGKTRHIKGEVGNPEPESDAAGSKNRNIYVT